MQLSGRSEQSPPCTESVSLGCDVRPSEWPLLVSDTLLLMHRGQRTPATITVTTLTSDFIAKVRPYQPIEYDKFLQDIRVTF